MKLKPRAILSGLAEVTLILRGGVKTRILAPMPGLVPCSVLLLSIQLEENVHRKSLIYVYICVCVGGKSQHL